jgi:pantoate--beta-alanine ligase
MIVTDSIEEVRQLRKDQRHLSWGVVPTMGYLHDGHLSLARRARAENDRAVASIYVNPTQFAPTEDLDSYPRDLERDLRLLDAEGIDLVFTPDDSVMYPPGFQTLVNVGPLTQVLEGASRPTHFQGVTTIVAKLFNILQPTRAYFGQKDAQQTIVLKRMVRDLNFDIEMIICPTVREADGLAQSSRNQYLSAEQRLAAPVLYRALTLARAAMESGQLDGPALKQLMTEEITKEALARIDYVSVADPATLEEVDKIDGSALVSMAVFFGKTRLIDNFLIELD